MRASRREPERVLERLQRQPQPRAAEQARGERIEELASRVAVGRGRVAEAEARRDELDVGAGRASAAASAWSYGGVNAGGSASTTRIRS